MAPVRRSRNSWLLLLAVVLLVNLPLVRSTWTRHQVETSGTRVSATVTETRNLGSATAPSWWLNYTLPTSVDPDGASWSAEVDAATFEQAEASGRLTVRAREGEPASAIAEGAVRSSTALIGTLVADALLALMLVLLWRFRGRGRPLPIHPSTHYEGQP